MFIQGITPLERYFPRSSGRLFVLFNLVAFPTIYRFISPGLECDHSLFSAAGTGRWKHLPGSLIVLTITVLTKALRLSFLPASGAPLGLIGKAFGGEEFLFFHCKGESFTTIDTSECFFLKCHLK
jgi:hypothetical protein